MKKQIKKNKQEYRRTASLEKNSDNLSQTLEHESDITLYTLPVTDFSVVTVPCCCANCVVRDAVKTATANSSYIGQKLGEASPKNKGERFTTTTTITQKKNNNNKKTPAQSSSALLKQGSNDQTPIVCIGPPHHVFNGNSPVLCWMWGTVNRQGTAKPGGHQIVETHKHDGARCA